MKTYDSLMKDIGYESKAHQRKGVAWGVGREMANQVKGGLIADEMGLGKTLQILAIMALSPRQGRTLIVVPPALLAQWSDAIVSILKVHPTVWRSGKRRLPATPIVLTTYGMVAKRRRGTGPLHLIQWTRVVCDEAHHLRNAKTRTHQGALALKRDITWLVTGTPIQNRQSDLYSLCAMMQMEPEYYTDAENLVHMARTYMLRRTKEQVGLNIPRLNKSKIVVPWNHAAEKRLVEGFHGLLGFSGVAQERGGNLGAFAKVPGATLPLMVRAKQLCIAAPIVGDYFDELERDRLLPASEFVREGSKRSSKLDAVVNHVDANRGPGKLIFCHYRREIDSIRDELLKRGFSVATFDGRTKPSDRQAILRAGAEVLILQIQTGCEGLNLQHDYSEVYFVSPHWNPSVEAQAVGRCHRMGQTEPVNVYSFVMDRFSSTTMAIDTHAFESQEAKLKLADKVLAHCRSPDEAEMP